MNTSSSDQTSSARELEEFYSTVHPEIWRDFYPRAYHEAGGFYSAKRFAVDCCTLETNHRIGLLGHVGQMALRVARRLSDFRMPTYFVHPGLLAAAANTAAPAGFAFGELKWPLDAMTFVLKPGTLVSPEDGPITFLSVAKFLAPGPGGSTQIGFFAQTEKGITFSSYLDVFGSSEIELISKDAPWLMENGGFESPILDPQETSSSAAPADVDFSKRLHSITLRLMLLMQFRPEFVVEGREVRPARNDRKKTAIALWSPNVIGAGYAMRTERSEPSETGISPRSHWRRGHWRSQAYGEGMLLRKTLWIEPVYIN